MATRSSYSSMPTRDLDVEDSDMGQEAALLGTSQGAPGLPSNPSRTARAGAAAVFVLGGCILAALRWSTQERPWRQTDTKAFESLVESPEQLHIPALMRDFEGNMPEEGINMFGDKCTQSKEIVTPVLGEDGKPVWSSKVGEGNIHTEQEFNAIWNTIEGINTEYLITLDFEKAVAGHYSINRPAFFPLDEYKKEGDTHNYYFSLELKTHFTYQGGEKFSFRGDDDVYLYINGSLVVNLGGCHGPQVADVDIDQLGLTRGKDYPFDFFFAERRCCGSSLRIDTSLQLVPTPVHEEDYSCCFFDFINMPWVCFGKKRFPWCEEED